MAEVAFYHLTVRRLEEVLPRLLEKIVAAGHRVVLRAPSGERLDQLDRLLWTYQREAVLPHGTRADGHADRQPIYLTTEEENPNGASVLVVVDGASGEDGAAFTRVVDLFDGNDPEAVAAARERWRRAREAGHRLVYWRQDAEGRWQRS